MVKKDISMLMHQLISTRISQGFLKSVTVPVIASDSEAIFW